MLPFFFFQTSLNYCVKYTSSVLTSPCNRHLTKFRSSLCLLLSSDCKGGLGRQTEMCESKVRLRHSERIDALVGQHGWIGNCQNCLGNWTSYEKLVKCSKSPANMVERDSNHSKHNQQLTSSCVFILLAEAYALHFIKSRNFKKEEVVYMTLRHRL